MNINPFELLKNAQQIQAQMSGIQQKLETLSVTGTAGGGMVQIDLNGKLEVMAVRIDPEAVDKAEIGMLQDLVKAAFSDAMARAREAIQAEMGPLAGGLGLGM